MMFMTNPSPSTSWYKWVDRIGVILAVMGMLVLCLALSFNDSLIVALALPVALTGAIMVIDAVLHEQEWTS